MDKFYFKKNLNVYISFNIKINFTASIICQGI